MFTIPFQQVEGEAIASKVVTVDMTCYPDAPAWNGTDRGWTLWNDAACFSLLFVRPESRSKIYLFLLFCSRLVTRRRARSKDFSIQMTVLLFWDVAIKMMFCMYKISVVFYALVCLSRVNDVAMNDLKQSFE